jgi:UDP-N-acetylglucosamine:LPS N-acetylglucosamine transferase
MRKILMLAGGVGTEETRVARHLCEAFEQVCPSAAVDVFDPFEGSLLRSAAAAGRSVTGMSRIPPGFRNGLDDWISAPLRWEWFTRRLPGLQRTLLTLLEQARPHCVISTSPAYTAPLSQIAAVGQSRPFRLITLVTASNSSASTAWRNCESDYFCVEHDDQAASLRSSGIPADSICIAGFPVSPSFAQAGIEVPDLPERCRFTEVLCFAEENPDAGLAVVDALSASPQYRLSVIAGAHSHTHARLRERRKLLGERLEIIGWTDLLPKLMRSSHLVVCRTSRENLRDALAAQCPIIGISRASNDLQAWEEMNGAEFGGRALEPDGVPQLLQAAFANNSALWRKWKRHLVRNGRPHAALRVARFALAAADEAIELRSPPLLDENDGAGEEVRLFERPPAFLKPRASLLCDFHIHSTFSDGRLSVAELVDFYGQNGFDCICVTDHIADPGRLIGRVSNLLGLVLPPERVHEYFDAIERERRRAWRKYGMIVLTGAEFNKDGWSPKSSAHILGVDLPEPLDPSLSIENTIRGIRKLDGLAIASHPHVMKTQWGWNTLYLWENKTRYAPILDAWEIANRHNIFNPVSVAGLPFLANSDFHQPAHLYSWKTILNCDKDKDAIKDCIRLNRDLSITLFRPPTRRAPPPRKPPIPKPVPAAPPSPLCPSPAA